MKKINIVIIVLGLLFGINQIASAQETAVLSPNETVSKPKTQNAANEFHKNEIYSGYSYQRFDVTPKENFHGFEVAYTRNVRRYVGLKFDFAARFSSQPCLECQPDFKIKASQYTFQGGVQIKDNSKETRVKPFGHALIGTARQREKICSSSGCPIASPVFIPFVMTLGGGIDVKVGKRIDFRVIQVDYNPAFKEGFRYHNLNIGVGIVFH